MVSYVNCAFRHPAVDIILYMKVCASEDVDAESRDDKAGEIKGLGVSGEGFGDFPENRELGLTIDLYSTVASLVDLKIEEAAHF